MTENGIANSFTYNDQNQVTATILQCLNPYIRTTAANRQGYTAYGEKRHGDDLLTDHNFTAPKGPPKRDATGLLYYQAMGNMPNLM